MGGSGCYPDTCSVVCASDNRYVKVEQSTNQVGSRIQQDELSDSWPYKLFHIIIVTESVLGHLKGQTILSEREYAVAIALERFFNVFHELVGKFVEITLRKANAATKAVNGVEDAAMGKPRF